MPALYVNGGTNFVGRDSAYGMRMREAYTATDYHSPSDQVKADWDMGGAVEDLRALFRVGYLVAQEDSLPQWKPGTEFRAKRDSMLAQPARSAR